MINLQTITNTALPLLVLLLALPAGAQEIKLTARDGQAGDGFGNAVAAGNAYAVVGVRRADFAGDRSGAAYVFVSNGGTWTQQAKLTADDTAAGDAFGAGVALSGAYAVVGAPGSGATGAAYVFVRNGDTWTQHAKLTADDAADGDLFGGAVALDGDHLVVGAAGDDDGGDNAGAAYVFTRTGDTWTQRAKLTAGDARAGNAFGASVAISADHLVVGALGLLLNVEKSGSAYVFTRTGEAWTQQAQLTANDGAFGDNFGVSVAIDGSTIVVGNAFDDDVGESSGSAYVFTRSGSAWTQRAKLTADDAAEGDAFGTALAVAGNMVVAGAPGSSGTGAAYVFTGGGTTWTQHARLAAGDAAAGDGVGEAVALANGHAVVTAPAHDARANNAGAAYVFALGATGTPVERGGAIPSSFRLDPSYPNPFNPATTIPFALPQASPVTLTVYTAAGATVATLVDTRLPAGHYTISWQPVNLASGVYLLRLQAGRFVATRSVTLLK